MAPLPLSRRLVRLFGLVAILVIWWTWSEQAQSLYFPPLSRVLEAFRENWVFERVDSDLVPSLTNMAAGFLLAVAVGVSAGLLLGLVRPLGRASQPVLEFVRAIPPPVFLSFGLLFLGTGSSMKVAVIALGPLWPILLNTVDGVRATDPARLDMARVFGLSRRATVTRIVLPGAMPRIAAGIRVGLPLALVLMVISELVGSTEGLGYFVQQSSMTYAIADMWSGIVLLGLTGWSLNTLMTLVERRLLRGHPRPETAGSSSGHQPRASQRRLRLLIPSRKESANV